MRYYSSRPYQYVLLCVSSRNIKNSVFPSFQTCRGQYHELAGGCPDFMIMFEFGPDHVEMNVEYTMRHENLPDAELFGSTDVAPSQAFPGSAVDATGGDSSDQGGVPGADGGGAPSPSNGIPAAEATGVVAPAVSSAEPPTPDTSAAAPTGGGPAALLETHGRSSPAGVGGTAGVSPAAAPEPPGATAPAAPPGGPAPGAPLDGGPPSSRGAPGAGPPGGAGGGPSPDGGGPPGEAGGTSSQQEAPPPSGPLTLPANTTLLPMTGVMYIRFDDVSGSGPTHLTIKPPTRRFMWITDPEVPDHMRRVEEPEDGGGTPPGCKGILRSTTLPLVVRCETYPEVPDVEPGMPTFRCILIICPKTRRTLLVVLLKE